MTYDVKLAGPARRHIENDLPPDVAWRLSDLIVGDLARTPRRLGHEMNPPFEGEWCSHAIRDYRVRYEVDEETRTVVVHAVTHRRDSLRSPGGRKGRRGR